ncbi:MAG: hypothetical protein V1716_05270 [Candidatus Uhrbacteria bacterium]
MSLFSFYPDEPGTTILETEEGRRFAHPALFGNLKLDSSPGRVIVRLEEDGCVKIDGSEESAVPVLAISTTSIADIVDLERLSCGWNPLLEPTKRVYVVRGECAGGCNELDPTLLVEIPGQTVSEQIPCPSCGKPETRERTVRATRHALCPQCAKRAVSEKGAVIVLNRTRLWPWIPIPVEMMKYTGWDEPPKMTTLIQGFQVNNPHIPLEAALMLARLTTVIGSPCCSYARARQFHQAVLIVDGTLAPLACGGCFDGKNRQNPPSHGDRFRHEPQIAGVDGRLIRPDTMVQIAG